eukprot:13889739-Alexandrium_andersonii.AAC.1
MLGKCNDIFKPVNLKPKRPWITDNTLQILEARAALCKQGKYKQAEALNKEVKASARADRRKWIQDGLQERYWDPVRILSRTRPPRVVRLESDTRFRKPAE